MFTLPKGANRSSMNIRRFALFIPIKIAIKITKRIFCFNRSNSILHFVNFSLNLRNRFASSVTKVSDFFCDSFACVWVAWKADIDANISIEIYGFEVREVLHDVASDSSEAVIFEWNVLERVVCGEEISGKWAKAVSGESDLGMENLKYWGGAKIFRMKFSSRRGGTKIFESKGRS